MAVPLGICAVLARRKSLVQTSVLLCRGGRDAEASEVLRKPRCQRRGVKSPAGSECLPALILPGELSPGLQTPLVPGSAVQESWLSSGCPRPGLAGVGGSPALFSSGFRA